MTMIFEISFLVTAGIFVFFTYKLNRKHFPPGPPNLPFLGSFPLGGKKKFHLKLQKWARKYGEVMGIRAGNRLYVVINDFETMKSVLADANTSGRLTDFRVDCRLRNGKFHGLIFSDGSLWKEQRRFALATLRDFGMGKTWLEDAVLAEVSDLCDEIKRDGHQPIDPKSYCTHSVSNIICALVFGKRFSHDDVKFRKTTSLLSEQVRLSQKIAIMRLVPFLKYVPGKYRNDWKEFQEIDSKVLEFMQSLIDEHFQDNEQTLDKRNYLDAFRLEKDGRRKSVDVRRNSIGSRRKSLGAVQAVPTKKNNFTDFQLLASVLDLFFAGTDTTSTTLLWAIVFLIENPDIQSKVYDEIKGHVADDRFIRMHDKNALPYTAAMIMEVQRLASIVPINMPHTTYDEMKINGFVVPKNSVILTNLYQIHRDERYWKDPERFDPNRFLDKNGKVIKPDGFVPFSSGKRACLGESLAKMELWLFLTNLIKHFEFVRVSDRTPTRDCDFAIILSPRKFHVAFKTRSN